MTNKQIDTVEQDERAAWRDHPAALDAKALATAQEITLMWGRDRSQFVSRIQVAVRDAMDWVRAASTSANVAQGAEAVVTVKVYETYTGQNGWIEVTQEEYDRTKDKYEHRIRRVPAPPAQTALTDEQIVALTKQVTGWTTHFAIPQEPHGHFYAGHHHKASVDEILRLARAALTAAHSGDTK
jgi:Mg-chelatase subunit ChlI